MVYLVGNLRGCFGILLWLIFFFIGGWVVWCYVFVEDGGGFFYWIFMVKVDGDGV